MVTAPLEGARSSDAVDSRLSFELSIRTSDGPLG
jgi:hypothetical protein